MSWLNYKIVKFLMPAIELAQKNRYTSYLLDRSYHLYKYLLEDQFLGHLPRLVSKGDLVVDVGANIGFYTKIFSKLVGPDGLVIAIEPCREHCRKLQALRLTNTLIFEQAAGASEGLSEFYLNQRHPGDHRCYQPGGDDGSFIKSSTPVGTLTTILGGHAGRTIGLIKIDVQGYEMAVLEGLQGWLSETGGRPSLILEISPTEILQADSNIREIEGWLRGNGYRLYLLKRGGLTLLESLEAFAEKRKAHDYFDILATTTPVRPT